MSTILPFVIAGLVTGAVYGLSGVGLVLTYKTSGIFNFAYGALATVAAYVFYTLHVQEGWAWPIAALTTVGGGGLVMGLLFARLAAALEGTSLAWRVTATVGVLLSVEAAIVLIYGQLETRIVPPFLAGGSFQIGGTTVQWANAITFGIALAATTALYVFFRKTRVGTAMRAVVDDFRLLGLAGTNPEAIRRRSWLISVIFASASGVLFSTLLPLDPVVLTLFVVQAFGAAAIGAFTSLPVTFAGGLLIGVVSALSTKYFQTGFLSGLPAALPFVVLFLVLLLGPRRYLRDRLPMTIPHARPTWTTPLPVQATGGALLLIFLVLVPGFAGIHLTDWTIALAMVISFLALGLLVRTTGQVSLCHVAFAAIGVCAFSHLDVGQGWPWPLALLASGLIAVPIGALLAIPAIRLSGLYLALATLGFGIVLSAMFYTESFMFGSSQQGLNMPRPGFASSDKAFYFFVLACAIAASVLFVALNRSRLGRLLRGLGDSPTALATNGTTVTVTRVLVFCIAAFVAAIAGALVGMAQQVAVLQSYSPLLSLQYLALIMIVIGGAPWFAVSAAAGLILIPSYLTGTTVPYWLELVFGVSAVLAVLTPQRFTQVPPPLRQALDRMFRRSSLRLASAPAVSVSTAPATKWGGSPVAAGSLQVDGLRVAFGGLVAVDDLSLAAATGRITGLIGPNGAGKTTTFNVCSGIIRPDLGTIRLDDRDVSRSGPAVRARHGLGRSFQKLELFDSLTVWDNVSIGREGSLAGGNPLAQCAASPNQRRQVREATEAALEACGIADLAHRNAGALSTGQRRLVELARCIAGPYKILLLDEPSSGLDATETRRFGETLLEITEQSGIGILLVEHDMSLVMDICDYIYVMDFGRLIFEGVPEAVRRSPIVQAAYLGDDEVELSPSPGASSHLIESGSR
jgi:ABC-type branched-subunit amino acid transport system ATPase component/branched-subunit amino acid ABC-type transport system permease component